MWGGGEVEGDGHIVSTNRKQLLFLFIKSKTTVHRVTHIQGFLLG